MNNVTPFKQKLKPSHLVDTPMGETIIDMCTVDDLLFVATTGGIYQLVGDELIRLKFKEEI